MLRNIENGKKYIGSAIHVQNRIKRHDCSFRHKTCNYKFIQDIEKGHKFTCEIVEKCDGLMFYELRDKEEFYAKEHNSFENGYNTACVPTYKPHTYVYNEETMKWLTRKVGE